MMSNETQETPMASISQFEKPHVLSVHTSGGNKMTQDNSSYASAGDVDKNLRAAEQQLESNEVDATLEASVENIGANVGNIDKIRDILFGGHMRDYDKRFKRLEERVAQEGGHLREEMLQRVKAIEDLLNNEIDNLGEKSKTERQERLLAVQDLQHDINGLKNELSNRLVQLDEQFTRDIKQLRQQTHTKFQELSMQLRQQNDSVTELVKREVRQLSEEKINRSDLAAFFTEFAIRLNKDFNVSTDSE